MSWAQRVQGLQRKMHTQQQELSTLLATASTHTRTHTRTHPAPARAPPAAAPWLCLCSACPRAEAGRTNPAGSAQCLGCGRPKYQALSPKPADRVLRRAPPARSIRVETPQPPARPGPPPRTVRFADDGGSGAVAPSANPKRKPRRKVRRRMQGSPADAASAPAVTRSPGTTAPPPTVQVRGSQAAADTADDSADWRAAREGVRRFVFTPDEERYLRRVSPRGNGAVLDLSTSTSAEVLRLLQES